jgi:L-alanine-DL-glutamate epimerase-like enolase superfamily enzyme
MMSGGLEFTVTEEVWPLHQPFRISRGIRTEARVIVVSATDGKFIGRGEAVPSRRYRETIGSVIAQLEPVFSTAKSGIDRARVQTLLSAGAARNAFDCALWDLEAKRSGKRVWELEKIPVTTEVATAFTISLDSPEKMAANVKAHAAAPILKLKLAGDDLDLARVQSVRQNAPTAHLLIDANEAWSPRHYEDIVPDLSRLGVELIEQPFPAASDEVLRKLAHPIPVCADESCHTTADLSRLKHLYQAINVKLDKTGGLTEALRLTASARKNGFQILFGCMVCTSLGIAPARLLTRASDYVDLDGPLLLAKDRDHGLHYENGVVSLPSRELWG